AYLVGPAYVDFLSNGREAHPIGNQDAFADYVPNNVYRCLNDEWLAITVRNDQEWQCLCETIGVHYLTRDGRMASVAGRQSHRAEVDAAINAWAAQQDAEQAMRQLQAAGVPAGKVQNMRDCTE